MSALELKVACGGVGGGGASETGVREDLERFTELRSMTGANRLATPFQRRTHTWMVY
jgi:hypothetical protein